jgi:hypothetical protein
MKPYLIITGVLFALLAAMHVWRAIAERQQLNTNPGEFFSMLALGMVAAGLSIWAWRLLRQQVRS